MFAHKFSILRSHAAWAVSAAVTLLGVPGVLAQPAYWDPAIGGNGHYYEVIAVSGGLNWWEARLQAAARGGHLATLGSAAENTFVHGLAAARTNAWFVDSSNNSLGPLLGGFQPDGSLEPAGAWTWITGEPLTFTNWAVNEPNNSGNAENCLQFFGVGPTNRAATWNDYSAVNNSPRGYVVEIDLSTATGFVSRDGATDFSPANNPNAPWTYGWASTPGSDFTAFNESVASFGLQIWRRPTSPEPGAVFNPTGNDIPTGSPVFAAGKFHLHPGPAGEFAILRFTCPITGVYEIISGFEGADTTGTSTDARVRVGTNQWFQSFINGSGPSSRRTYRGAATLAAGAIVEFAVGPNGSHGFDSTRVDAQIKYRRTFDGTEGEIAYPGEVDSYSFRLAAPKTMYFDAQLPGSSLSWSLVGQSGTMVSDRPFANSDADNAPDPLLRLPPGDYTLTVRGSGDTTGPYQFKLVDLAEATLITPGVIVGNPEFEHRTTDLYQFTANAGDVLTFDQLTALNGGLIYWRLIDPYGRISWANYFSDQNNFTLPATGVYTLLLEGLINGSSASSYSFRLTPNGGTPPPAFTGTPLAFDTTVSNLIATAGTTNAYTFTLGQDAILYVDSLLYQSNLRYTLLGPGGVMASTRAFSGGADSDLHRLPAGNYQFVVSASGGYTGPFVFRILDLAGARSITLGTIVRGTNTPANSVVPFRFNTTPGTRVFFDVLSQSGFPYFGNCYWTLRDPYGRLVFADVTLGDRNAITLTGQGTYTLWVNGGDQETGTNGTFAFNVVPVTETSTALALNTEYQGLIAQPAQRHVFTFSINERKRVYFQSRTNESLVRWSLLGPGGFLETSLAFNSGGWLAYWLDPGDYVLTVFANGDDTAGYAFKLVDFATSTPLSIGPVINTTVTPARTIALRDLSLTAGDRLFVDTLSQSGFVYFGNPSWRLEDPEGNTVFLPDIGLSFDRAFGDIGPFTVQRTGTYHLLMGGAIQETAPSGNFSFRIVRVTNSTEAIAFNQTVETTIAAPGQRRIYTFSLGVPSRILVDNLQNVSGLRWTLKGADRVYANAIAFSTHGWHTYELPAGTYELTVDATGDDTGTAPFRLQEIASAAQAMTLNSLISSTSTPPSENRVYQFSGTAGQRVYFDVISQTGFPGYGVYWLVITPSGNELLDVSANDRGPLLLPETGVYRLVVGGHLNEATPAGTLNFQINDAPLNTAPLTLDALTTGALLVGGEWDRYTFSVGQITSVAFDSRTNSPLRWTLTGPSGVLVNARAFSSSDSASFDSFRLLPPGDYTLDVNGAGDDTGGYAFIVRTAASGEALTLNTTVNGSLDPANMTRIYRFNATAGDRVRFQTLNQTGLGNCYWRLQDPVGDPVWANYIFSGSHSNRLERTGTYTLLIEGNHGDPGSGTYSFSTTTFTPIPPTPPSGTPIVFGQTISNALAASTTVQSYLVTLSQPGRIYLDLVRAMDGFSWALLGPTGPIVPMHPISGQVDPPLPTRVLPAGAYEFQLTGSTTPYGFRFLSLEAAPLYVPGTVTTNTITPATGASLFRVNLSVNQRYYFDVVSESGFSSSLAKWLQAPAGHSEFSINSFSDPEPFNPKQSGEHILFFDGPVATVSPTGTVAFALNLVAHDTNALTFGTTISGTLAAGFKDIDTWTFTLPTTNRIFFDVLNAPPYNWSWSLSGPAGDEVVNRSPLNSDGNDFGDSSLLLPPGAYRLRVNATTTQAAFYRFRLWNAVDAGRFDLGTVVTTNNLPSSTTTLLRFNGTKDQLVYFDSLAQSGPAPILRVYSPSGTLLRSDNANADIDTFTLPMTGEYVVSLEGNISQTGPGSTNTFSYRLTTHSTNQIGLDQIVSGTITQPGNRHYWNFSLPVSAFIWFDALTNAPGANWTLTRGLETLVNGRSFTASDGLDFADSMLRLPAGGYRIVVALGNNNTGTYAFRLVSDSGATPIALGGLASAMIDPPNGTKVVSLYGAAGTRWYFDGRPFTGGGVVPVARLYSPTGLQMFSRNANDNEPTFTLPVNGTYYLSLECQVAETGGPRTANFAFVANPIKGTEPLYENSTVPDLTVPLVSVTPASGLKSGDNFTVTWTVRNTGNDATASAFTDRVVVRNVTLNQIILNTTLPYDPASPGAGPIDPQTSRNRQLNLTLPAGFAGAGSLEAVVTTDTSSQIAEQNPAGTGEANNSGSTTFVSSLAPYPDLAILHLSANPATNWSAGTVVQLNWAVTNSGPAATSTSWVDRVIVRHVGRATVLLSTNVSHSVTLDGPLTSGSARLRSTPFILPPGVNSQGEFAISIDTDALGQVVEAQANSSGETNNSATLTVRSAPNLRIVGLTVAPSPSAQSGANLLVQWQVINSGSAPVAANFSDRIVVRNTASGATLLNTTSGYNLGTAGNGPIPPGGSRARSVTLRLPDGTPAVGLLEIELTADTLDQITELTTTGSGETDNTALTTLTTILAPYPDLRVANVTVAPGAPQSGQEITIRWEDRNAGTIAASLNWNDRVQILNTTSGASLLDTTVSHTTDTLGPLAPGASRLRQHLFRLPHGQAGSGPLRAVITADTQNTVFENHAVDTAESNNVAFTSFTSTLAAYPDLAAHSLDLAPATFESGRSITVSWILTNIGTAPVTGDFYDRLLVRNLPSGSTISDQSSYFNPVADTNGPIAPGTDRRRSATFRLPDGAAGAGNIDFTLFLDSGNRLFEFRESADAEANNTTNRTRTSTLALYPDLAVRNVAVSGTPLPGEPILVTWRTDNQGAAATPGPWTDQVFLVDDANPSGALLLATFNVDGVLAASGGTSNFAHTVTLPFFTVGQRRLAVRANTGNAFFEPDMANNYALSAGAIQLAPRLDLTLNRGSAPENGGSNTVILTALRNGSASTDLTIFLTNSDPSVATVAASLVLPAGQASRAIPVTLINNAMVDEARAVHFDVGAAGYAPGSADLVVLDDDSPLLTFQTSVASVQEDLGANALMGFISRNGTTNTALVVALTTDAPGRLLPPTTVTIPPGSRSAAFGITAPANTVLEGDRSVRLQATAPGYPTAAATVVVIDNDVPQLTLSLAANAISEGAESPATTAVLTRGTPGTTSLLVALNSSISGLLLFPGQITIPAGQASIGFNINVTDDTLVNGPRVAQIIARPYGIAGVPITNGQAVANLNVYDNDGATLTLVLARDVVNENGSVSGTVSRNTGSTGSLVVALGSSDPGEAVPATATVTIPNGGSSAPFTISGIPDGLNDGIQSILITATASGYNSGNARLNVSDIDLPDLAVGDIIVPSSGQIDARANVTYTVANAGPVAANGSWIDRIYISTDNQLGGDTLAGSVTNTAPLGHGSSYTRTASITLPADPARYHIIVVTDVDNQIAEGNERNNVISIATIDVQPNYRASVETDIVSAPCGTAVPIRGRAYNPDDNSPARFKFVTIRLLQGGTRRLFNVISDADGLFHYTFTPLANETGDYRLAADHPRVNEDTPQDSFSLLGFSASAEAATMTIVPQTPISGQIILRNGSGVPLIGITAAAPDAPAALGLQLSVPASMAGNAAITLDWSLNTTITNAARVVFPLNVTSAEGCHQRVMFTVSIAPLRPQLVAEPAFLERGMVRGAQVLVPFTLRNVGGVPTGPIEVLPPPVSWLTIAGTNQLDSLEPGVATTVTLLLAPPSDLPLSVHTGTIGIGNGNAALVLPFRFRAVSTAVGDVRITATDDYTYYVAGSPKLTNAQVTITDPFGGGIVTNGVTDAAGEVRFTNLPEGAYTIDVTASKHNSFRGTVTVQSGTESTLEAFLVRQTVSYRWSVVPLEIPDRYKIVLESVFETEVPIPNVIVEEPYIMPLVFQGETNQFEIALRNEGLIAAENVEIIVPNHPDYLIEPLVRKIGTIPAKSRITMPVLISRRVGGFVPAQALGTPDEPLFQAAGGGGGCELDTAPCLPKIPMGVNYYYVCGPNGVLQQRSIDLSPVCLAKDAKECIEKTLKSAGSLHDFRNGGNAASFACDLLEAILQCAGVSLTPCQSAALSIACGALTGGAAGAAGGAAGGSSLECICELVKNLNISLPPSSPNYGTVNYVNGSLLGTLRGGYNGYPWSGGYYIGPGTCSSPSPAPSPAAAGDGGIFAPAGAGGVCARVRIQIDQDAVLTRVAFKGSLEIENDSAAPINGIRLTLDMRDVDGQPAGARFVTRPPVVTGMGNVDGTGSIPAFGAGSAEYLFIPTRDAAPTAPSIYRIGGSLRYLDNGQEVVVPLSSATITVYPEARLQLKYFQSRNVFSDDPFTDFVEPAEPFALGLLARNVGAGDARNFHITSAQPKIIENQKGLLIDFKIIGSQVGSNAVEPSLTVNLGTIPAGRSQIAQWILTSSLQGKFIDYKATFEHVDNFGSTNLSLIDGVEIHELIHAVLADRPGDDRVPDFLANDIPDPDDLPDIIHLSDGSTALVESRTAGTFSNPIGAGLRQTTLTFAAPASGWVYVDVPDPGPGWQLSRVVRSDQRSIRVGTNAWTTDRTFPSSITGVRREYRFHLLDYNSTGSYTLFYRPVDTVAPTLLAVGPVTPSLQMTPVNSIEVVFSEEIDAATLDPNDLILTLDGGPNRINAGVTITQTATNRFTIDGLSALTAADGNYAFRVDATGVADFGDNLGQGSLTTTWSKGGGAPVVTSLGPVLPNPRNEAVSMVEVVFSRTIREATFTAEDLVLTRNGGPNLVTSVLRVETLDTNRFLITGLATLTQSAGTYRLAVLSSGLQDINENNGAGIAEVTWSMLTSGPEILSLERPTTTPRNIVVASLEVAFASPVNPAGFDWQDISLTRDGGPNLITSAVRVQQITPTVYRVSNFNWVSGQEGRYVFTVNAAGIVDPAGNSGTGSATVTWTMDTTRPPVPTGLALNPDRGVSSSDALINTLSPTLTGTAGESNLTVRVKNLTTGVDYGPAQINGTSFSKVLALDTAGAHKLEVRSVDAAGNTAFPDVILELFVDLTRPSAEIAPVQPSLRNTAVDSLSVTFSEAINPATFTRAALSLRRQNGPNLINAGVAVVNVTSNQYQVTGLTGLTDTAGTYEFALNMGTVEDHAGNSGTNVVAVTWSRTGANRPPILAFIPDRTAKVGSSIVITNVTTDPDAGQTLRYSLNLDAPANARLGEANGVFRWSPTRSQSPGFYQFTVTVIDDGVPAASASRTFTVSVDEFTETSLGEAVLLAGENGAVPLALVSTAGLTNLVAEVSIPGARMSPPTLVDVSQLIGRSSLQDLGDGRYRVSLVSQPGQSIRGSNVLAELRFGTVHGQSSAFVPLPIGNITARQPDGTAVSTTFTRDGRVVVIGDQPLLELVPTVPLRLRLFAHPGDAYDLESANAVAAPWQATERVRFTTREMSWNPPLDSAGQAFYRLVSVDVTAPIFEILSHDDTGLDVVFYSERGRTFDLQTTDRLGPPWTTFRTQNMTNVFHEFRLTVPAGEARFLRARGQ